MPTYKLFVEYDGSALGGFQIQTNARTVQEEIEKALKTVLQKEIRIIGAGRTDAGVHATGQVAHFCTDSEIPIGKTLGSLNSLLPDDVVLQGMEKALDSFHARYSAQYRQYSYRVALKPLAVFRQYAWYMPYQVDWKLVEMLLKEIEGLHDFGAFCASGSWAKTHECNVLSFSLEEHDREIVFHIRANRFLYKMVRSLVGTLVDIGRGHLPKNRIQEALKTGNRQMAGQTAPARGLTLVKVGYLET